MELKIPRQEFLRALHRAQGIIERKTTMPILANVLLECSRETGFHLTAFDGEIGLQCKSACEVLKDGVVAMPGRYLYDIVKALPDAHVHLKRTPNSQVEISCGPSRFKIVSTPSKDYPPLPSPEGAVFFGIASDTLALMIERTQFAISTDESRYNLSGVFLEQAENQNLRMVATDGHRLSLSEKQQPPGFRLDKGVIVPRKGLSELRRLVGEEPGECEIGLTPGSLIFRRPGIHLVMRLLDGMFPDYRQVIPKETTRSVRLSRSLFLESLRRVSLISQDKTSGIKLELVADEIVLSSQNPDLGEAVEQVPATVSSPGLKVGFNARYLIDVLSVLTCDNVELSLSDELSPGLMKPVGEDGYLAVVMPMRI